MPPGEKSTQPATEGVQTHSKTFKNKRNQNIHCYYWKPQSQPRALLMISHGYTEHAMVYDVLAREIAAKGVYIFAHDQAGHGHSDGKRAYINKFNDLVEDSLMHIELVRKEFPDLPLFLCGHSMGGATSLAICLLKEIEVKGVVLIAPALASNPETAPSYKVHIAKLFSKFLPFFPLGVTDFRMATRNETKIAEMMADPLRFNGYWKARPVVCLLQGAEEISSKMAEMDVPFLLLHGDSDKVCHISGSNKLYEQCSASDKTYKVYPGAYHSLLLEPDDVSNDVLERTVKWFEARL